MPTLFFMVSNPCAKLKTMKKILFVSAVFLLAIFLTPKVALAQGPCLPNGTLCYSLATPRCSNCCNGHHVVGYPGGGVSICGPASTPTPAVTPTPGNADLWCDYDSTTGTGTQLNTAIGCIPILGTKEAFLSFILKWAVGIGGGIAFLLIIYAGFMIMTSAGNPERLKAGQELLTSAISGLILLIFSVVILKIIGVDILGLGRWGFGK